MTSTEKIYELYLRHPVISTDTRKIEPGSLFFALKGDKFNANTFAQQAINAGAAYTIIDEPAYRHGEQFILVEDVLTALQELAMHHRSQLTIPVIGLTGTNGKTTTKELISSVLSQRYRTQATAGNLNNHIGVPLTVLSIRGGCEIAVIEMGANHQKEIAMLCSIARPTHGLITNVGKAHLEGFGGVEGVKKGKGELYDFLGSIAGKSGSWKIEEQYHVEKHKLADIQMQGSSGIAFISSSNKTLVDMQLARDLKQVVFYGDNPGDLVSGEITENAPLLTIRWKNNKTGKSSVAKTHLTGAYNLDNLLAAICTGVYFGLNDDEINCGLESYQPKNNRSQIVHTETNTLICDYYNANPSSMAVAIENVARLSAKKKVLILGDMFEMGDEANAEHTAIIQKTLETAVDKRIFIGQEFYSAGMAINDAGGIKSPNIDYYKTAEDAMAGLRENPVVDSTILIKGSRGMALERLVELF